ncbi:MAG TPA: VWA domain-containing protein [Ktedonobacteraceae bacterium]
MQTHFALSPSALPVEHPTTVDLLITLRPQPSTEPRATRRPFNLSLVIDRSGSMAGRSLKQALNAAETLVEQLGPDDLLSLVVYDDTVETILPPGNVFDKQAIREIIRRVRAGGTTNLSGGWLKGCEHVLARRGADMIHRVLLLTDGQANVGVVDPKVLIATARHKADDGVVTTTLGFGANFNEDLLIGMAQAAGGNFYFIQTPDDAEEVFRIEVESLASVVAQNLALTIAPVSDSGVQIRNLYSNYRTETQQSAMTLSMGDLYENEDKLLALELTIPAQTDTSPGIPLLAISYRYEAVADGAIQSFSGTAPLIVSVPVVTIEEAIAAAPATDVVLQISRIRIAKAKDTAIELADSGDVTRAAQTLRQISADLRQQGLDEQFEIAEEIAQLEHFAERLEHHRFDSTSRKEMRDQSYQAQMRSRADLSLRGTAGGSAADLDTTAAVNGGVELACSREGGKLRMRVASEGYDQNVNVQFPRNIREEGVHYVVDVLQLSANGTFYRAVGNIRRLALPGQEHRYKGTSRFGAPSAGRNGPPQASKVSARTAADLETTINADDGVLVQCIREGSKLRARVVSDGYDPNYNMRFPRDIREEGVLYVVDQVIETANGGSYMACGKIRRLIQ